MDLLRNLDTLARREGVAMTALKGAALHALGVYRAGQRPMADVDLLVRDSDLAAADARPRAGGLRDLRHAPGNTRFSCRASAQAIAGFGEHAANPIKIDLHARIFERLPVAEVDITQQVLGIAS